MPKCCYVIGSLDICINEVLYMCTYVTAYFISVNLTWIHPENEFCLTSHYPKDLLNKQNSQKWDNKTDK